MRLTLRLEQSLQGKLDIPQFDQMADLVQTLQVDHVVFFLFFFVFFGVVVVVVVAVAVAVVVAVVVVSVGVVVVVVVFLVDVAPVICIFTPYLGKIPVLTDIFRMG